MTCANKAPPLGLSWGNVTVSDDGKAVARGIGVGIGNPPQIVALAPSIGNDVTWLFNADDCVNSANSSCIGAKGGVFNRSLSHTFVQTTQAAWNGSHTETEFNSGSYIFFNDELTFGDDQTSPGFPLILDQPGYGSQSGLGLSANSTFLNTVVQSGFAPSRSFGLWVGSRSLSNPVDGALWIGGYDTARVADDFTVFPNFNNDQCVACVVVTNMTYINSKGSTSLFSNDTEALAVSLDPFAHGLQVSGDIFANFIRASGGTVGTAPGTQTLVTIPTNGDLGNLSVTFSNGYQTVIPYRELFLPPRTYGQDGTYAISNNTYYVAGIINSTVAALTTFDWGIPILTMNYMIMDYDNDTFSLAPARQGAYGASSGALVQPLCKGVAPVTTTAASPSPTANITSAGATPPSATPTSKSSHTNVGAIAGGVVGGVIGLVIIALLAYFLLRSKRKQNKLERERDSVMAGSTVVNSPRPDRSSHVPTSPTEVSEVDQKNINQWLHSQDKFIVGDHPQGQYMQKEPLEMPTDRHV